MAKKIILIILSQVLVKSISPYGHSLSLDSHWKILAVFLTREILSPLHHHVDLDELLQVLLLQVVVGHAAPPQDDTSLGHHHLASVVDRCHLRLLLGVVLETGVAQLLEVGQTRPVVVPGQDKLQNKLKLVFP